jgi:alkylation response protein AidB-like acyl-CoA dehydrogenase
MTDAPTRLALPMDAEYWLGRVAASGPTIAAGAEEGERIGRVPDAVMAALHGDALFRILMPREFGGAEVPPPVYFRIVEAIAKHDASTAWCVAQGNGCAMLAAYVTREVAETIFGRDTRAVLSWGQGPAQAHAVDGGYRISARASFVSGGHHATWFGAHAPVFEKDGAARIGADGVQETRTFLFPPVPLNREWQVMGLRATGSDGFEIADMFVREAYSVVREAPTLYIDRPLFLYSQMNIYGLGFAAVALGIARTVVDEFLRLAREKKPRLVAMTHAENPIVHDELARCEARLSSAREYLLLLAERMWEETVRTGKTHEPSRVAIRLAATHAIREAADVAEILFATAGTAAVFTKSPFERRLRDVHMVAQQIQGRKSHFQAVGAWMLGHPIDSAII